MHKKGYAHLWFIQIYNKLPRKREKGEFAQIWVWSRFGATMSLVELLALAENQNLVGRLYGQTSTRIE